jgi:putative ABC transport system substrate-binding protein
MHRRKFIAGFGSVAAWPLVARAQSAMPVVGFLHPLSLSFIRPEFIAAFHRGLGETGFVQGRNVSIEFRLAEGQNDRLPALHADLLRHQAAVIAAPSVMQGFLKSADRTIPIVFMVGGDPVESGLVASINRPDGNLTGVSVLNAEVTAKRLELLHELVPTASSIAFLVNRQNSILAEAETQELQLAADKLGLRLLILPAVGENEITTAFATLVEQRVGGLLMNTDPILNYFRYDIIALANRHAIPAVYHSRDVAEAGGLMSYGPSLVEAYRQVGVYTGRILKGDKPNDLPVVRSTRIECVINLKTAKSLGLIVPTSLLLRADEVIE